MRNFDETMWSPAGARPHIEVPVPDPVRRLARAYLAQTRAWWAEQGDDRPFETVFRIIDEEFLHLTVGWLDRLTTDLAFEQLDALYAALAARLSHLEPFAVTVGPAIAGRYALEMYVVPNPQATALAAAVRAAIRDIFGAQAAPEPAPARLWRPHISVFYGSRAVDTDALASRIAYTLAPGTDHLATPVTMPVDAVLLVDQDTWGNAGLSWDNGTTRTIKLGQAHVPASI